MHISRVLQSSNKRLIGTDQREITQEHIKSMGVDRGFRKITCVWSLYGANRTNLQQWYTKISHEQKENGGGSRGSR